MTVHREAQCTIRSTSATYELRDSGFYVDGVRLPLDPGVVELALVEYRLETGEDLANGQGLLPCSLAERIIRTASRRAVCGLTAELSQSEFFQQPDADSGGDAATARSNGYLHDNSLTESLATIIRTLKAKALEGAAASEQFDKDLGEEIHRFGQSLDKHFSFEENTLFKPLLEASPQTSHKVFLVLEEHHQLRLFHRYLAERAEVGDARGACDIARALLAQLLEHMERESRVIDEARNARP